MKLRIRDFSRLCGINMETIRYYEQQNLLHPHREEKNSFRSFNEQDFILLAQLKQLQGLGCSLRECTEVVTPEQTNSLLEKKQELASVADRLSRVKQMRRQFDHIDEEPFEKIAIMNGIYRIFFSQPDVLNHPNTPHLLTQLIQLMPFSHSTIRISYQALVNPQDEFTVDYGLGILERYAKLCSFVPEEPMEYIAMSRGLVMKLVLL